MHCLAQVLTLHELNVSVLVDDEEVRETAFELDCSESLNQHLPTAVKLVRT